MSLRLSVAAWAFVLAGTAGARAGVGDPQVRSDHVWYPGELACSTFERLFAAQAEQYRRVTGRAPKTDEEKARIGQGWQSICELTRLLFTEPSPAPAKYWLARSGLIDSAEVRLPMVEVSAELAARLDFEIERRKQALLQRA